MPPLRRPLVAALLCLAVAPLAAAQLAEGPATDLRGFALRPGDRIALVGNALAERMQHDGWFESRLQCRLPDHGLVVRNLGFSADELTVRQRTAGFGSPSEWLDRVDATVVLAFFGGVESFRGPEHLPTYREDLAAWIAEVRALDTGAGAPRVVLCSPIPVEDTGDPDLPDAEAAHRRLEPYVRATAEVAAERGVPFVDLYSPLRAVFEQTAAQAQAAARWTGLPADRRRRALGDARESDLTIDGTHLTTFGNAVLAEALEGALVPLPPDDDAATADDGAPNTDDTSSADDTSSISDSSPAPTVVRYLSARRMKAVRDAVRGKNLLWFNRYRATDGYNVYGGRSSLAYVDGVTNYEVLQREMEVLDAMCGNLDAVIHDRARGGDGDVEPGPVPPLMDVVTNRPGDGPDGAHVFRDGEQAVEAMTLHDGFAVNLFADEQRFPEIANPVQMAWDTAGRLWVAAWPTYPHWMPGQPMNDGLFVLEDIDGDGTADRITPFADDLHNPTGFEFWGDGVLVANPPDLLYLEDTDSDGVADLRQRVLHGLSSADTHHSANSFVYGPDGAFYFQEGVFHMSQVESPWGPVRNRNAAVWRFEPRTWRVERYVPYGFANPHGHVFDRWGQDFVTDGTGNQNYWALPISGWLPEPLEKPGTGTFFRQRSRPAAATEILSSSHFPDELQGNYLVANVIGFQGIFQYEVHDDGAGFSATEVQPIVHSSDPNFRPVDMEIGPDGALYVLDWQAPLIGHMQHHLRDPSRDHTHGRIYRFTYPGRPPSEPPVIEDADVPELVAMLGHPEDRVRSRVRLELTGRESEAVVSAASRWFVEHEERMPDGDVDEDTEHHLLEVLWTLAQHGPWTVPDRRPTVTTAQLERLLTSPVPEARAAAVRVLRHTRVMREREEGDAGDAEDPTLVTRDHPPADAGPTNLDLLRDVVARDDHPRVLAEVLVALSFLHERASAELALGLFDRTRGDRFLEYAHAETLRALEPWWRAPLARGERLDAGSGLRWALGQLDADELLTAAPSADRDEEILSRHGLPAAAYATAITSLAAREGRGVAGAFTDAVVRADARDSGHVDHLLSGLFAALDAFEPSVLASLDDALGALSRDARRPTTRRLALAARLARRSDPDRAWDEATRSAAAMTDLLEALPLLPDAAKREAFFPHVVALADDVAGTVAGVSVGGEPPRARFVRVSLPGAARTLTLAEVEVWSGGRDVALDGTASQSSENWGGVAERGIDGITSGAWVDGGQTHTMEDLPDPWWEVDLGAEHAVDAVSLWNRTDGDFETRLDGYRLALLDAERRPVHELVDQPAPRPTVRHELLSADIALRRAALRALARLDVLPERTVRELRRHADDALLRGAVLDGLLAAPLDAWPDDAVEAQAAELVARFAAAADGAGRGAEAADMTSVAGAPDAVDPRELALADALLPRLDRDVATRLLALSRRLGPRTIVLRPVPDALLYDLRAFTVVAGQSVALRFENTDIMPHNVVVTVPGALATVGLAAEDMAADPDAWDRAFVPDLPEVLHASRLLQPGETATLEFTAPDPGDYPYVCTFPGHWVRMNGVMTVVPEEEAEAVAAAELDATTPAAPTEDTARETPHPDVAPAAGRAFVRFWSVDDFTDLDRVDDADPARGRAVFEVASCVLCHRVGGEGGLTGPPMEEVVARHDRASLLAQVLDPSGTILEGYASEVVVTTGGGVLSGRVLEEDGSAVTVQVDPYTGATQRIPPDEIARRRTSRVSAMPEGLLSTFTEDEVLALLAYLEHLRDDG